MVSYKFIDTCNALYGLAFSTISLVDVDDNEVTVLL